VLRLSAIALTLSAAAAIAAGCGAADPATTVSPAVTPIAAKPALATDARGPGEVVVEGEASPRMHGPVELHGRYRVRFRQYAPEDPQLPFADQTAFVVDLEKREGIPDVHVFESAAAAGSRTVRLDGRYFIDVSFGDFPYVVRFTPVDG
jgi:hypothetical protein